MSFFEIFTTIWLTAIFIWLFRIESLFSSIQQWIMHLNGKRERMLEEEYRRSEKPDWDKEFKKIRQEVEAKRATEGKHV